MGTVEAESSKTLAQSPEKIMSETLVSDSAKQENGVKDSGETQIAEKMASLDVEEDGVKQKDKLEDNGVSLNENGDNLSWKVVNNEENEDVEVEDLGSEEGHEFRVGDFVWGKIRSHPWWPGQIYDPSNASEKAEKIKYEGRLLVAYFGDGTFAWCRPSQLKPFEENFDVMSTQSNGKSFLSAVQQAVDEIGRVLELKMVCSCVPKQNRTGLGQLWADNAGVKQGSLVPEGEIRKLTDVLAEPSELLAELKRVAQVYVTNGLMLRVLKSRLSAFYRAKGGHELRHYRDPKPIHGLYDGEKKIEAPFQGPMDEDWFPRAIDVSTGKTDESWLQSNPVSSDNRRTAKKKERLIADIISTKETNLENSVLPSGAKKRKSRGEFDRHDEISSISPKGKKRRTSISNVSSIKKYESKGNEETKEGSTSRGRPKKKVVVDFENDDNESKNKAGDRSGSRKLKLENSSLKSDDSAGNEQFERSPSFRERKKSKYLSPPFTNLSSVRKRDVDDEIKISSEDRAGEVNMSPRQTMVSPQILKCSLSETLPYKVSTEPGLVEKKISSSTILDNIIRPPKANVSANKLLSEVLSAAANPLTLSGKKPLDVVTDFMSVYRNSVYKNGSYYKLYKNSQSSRKRKRLDSVSGLEVEDPKQHAKKSPKKKQNSGADKEKGKQSVETLDQKSSGRRKQKQETAAPEMKRKKKRTNDRETPEEKDSPAYLFATFGPGSTLPTKTDLIQVYGKYGELDEKETDMFYNNFFGRVCFVKSLDAEVALSDSEKVSPFASATVSFRLQYGSGVYKTRELSEISSQRSVKTSKKRSKLQANGSGQSDLGFVKQKLQMISSMLEDTPSEVSATMKSKLQGEIKGLLEKVSTKVGSSSKE